MALVREIRILISWHGELKALFKVALGQRDASLYFFPYGARGEYFYGSQSMKEHQMEQTFPYKEQFSSREIPKLSIHQSGQVHIYCSTNQVAGPLRTIPLSEWRGHHIASVTADSFDSLTEYTRETKNTGFEIDLVIPSDDTVESGRINVYCNGQSPDFVYDRSLLSVVQMRRPELGNPICIGFHPITQPPLGDIRKGGVTVITGWNPKARSNTKRHYLYIRAL